MTDAITASGLTVSYGDTLALDDLDFTVEPGLVHGLIGMNGSGKSTLFKALMGLVKVDAGEVRLYGADPERARRAGRVAYAPQNEDVDWAFPVSVEDVVTMGRYGQMGWRRRTREEDRRRVSEALERVELLDLRDRQIGALSGGQRKRAFVARGLAQGAELLFLDEPFAGVDKRSEATITELLRDLAAEGRTIVVSTHDLVAVPALCDRVALINRRIIAHGDADDVLRPDLLAEAFGGFVPQEALRA
ncbi:metal ABC transporter ATP-binding protein [Solirubrobacter sp. CPCC 204708]|uniref:Metal ABC transporter ATP-binding protein n=1 Tax=Solirubrobacter deserti TaxID=2282478 RepID=A0ABT4RMU1_9ACTN|nr:metal ABC transporter ATP-binding protein [Solirubrobacter deserti]MBE2320126.1 metal ABC transporter ATP-binding protein [Solirubrobacter deserti]MDA0139846.1 metal ABC transporter ATP-binding protein [Solirubrobacter deserti]